MKAQRPGIRFESTGQDALRVQKVRLEMSFGQVLRLCFQVALAQIVLVPVFALGAFLVVAIVAGLMAKLGGLP